MFVLWTHVSARILTLVLQLYEQNKVNLTELNIFMLIYCRVYYLICADGLRWSVNVLDLSSCLVGQYQR